MVHTKVIIIITLAVIAILFSTILIARGLINIRVPENVYGEKLRFLRTLSCSYAMCARSSCDSVIIDIGFLDNIGNVSCYKVCNEWEKKGFTGHKCGPGFKLEFVFKDNTVYSADKKFSLYYNQYNGIDTDITQYNQGYWYHYINNDGNCFNGGKSFRTCKYDHGLLGEFPQGKCEGIIEKAPNNCQRLGGGGQWTDADENTGHIWIGPDVTSGATPIAQCGPFGINGDLGNPLYANCTFNKGKTVYISTELDKYDECFIVCWASHYCPELILCSS
jgi:hypothetical protein